MLVIKRTSLEVYNKLVSDGTLSRKRLEVAEFIATYGPTYQRKAHKVLGKLSKGNSSTYMSRFCELEAMGVITVVGEGVDEDTGNRVKLYDLTGNMPNVIKRLTGKQREVILKDAINKLWTHAPKELRKELSIKLKKLKTNPHGPREIRE